MSEEPREPFLSQAGLFALDHFINDLYPAFLPYKVVIFPNALTRIMTKAATAVLKELKEKGTTREMLDRMLSHGELFELFEFPRWVELEKKYLKI